MKVTNGRPARVARRVAVALGLVALAAASPLRAQGPGHGPGMDHPPDPEHMLSRLQENLALTADQVDQLRTMMAGHKQEMDAIHQQMDAVHQKMQALHEEMAGQMAQVLTDEQNARLKELREEHHGRMGGRKDGGPGWHGHGGACPKDEGDATDQG